VSVRTSECDIRGKSLDLDDEDAIVSDTSAAFMTVMISLRPFGSYLLVTKPCFDYLAA
jgi:hypothetical protein